MRFKVISCEVFVREMCAAIADSPHVVDVVFLPFGLHDTPETLRLAIQDQVDACEDGPYEAVVLAYALCSRGTAGIRARTRPLVVPKAHDCITLLLGSRQKYSQEFADHPGTYYFSPGWAERKDGEVQQGFIQDVKAASYKARFQEYVEKYGEDNAQFLIGQETQWLAHYTRAAFINTGLGDQEGYRTFTQQLARERGWEFGEIPGELGLIRRMVNGEWDSDDFVVLRPGQCVVETFDSRVLAAGEAER